MEPEISVVVPLRNESANVLALTQRIFAALEKVSGGVELILVDDASSDDTWQQILQARQAYPGLRAIRHAQNLGQSAALWTGIQATTGPILATLDGDLRKAALGKRCSDGNMSTQLITAPHEIAVPALVEKAGERTPLRFAAFFAVMSATETHWRPTLGLPEDARSGN